MLSLEIRYYYINSTLFIEHFSCKVIINNMSHINKNNTHLTKTQILSYFCLEPIVKDPNKHRRPKTWTKEASKERQNRWQEKDEQKTRHWNPLGVNQLDQKHEPKNIYENQTEVHILTFKSESCTSNSGFFRRNPTWISSLHISTFLFF